MARPAAARSAREGVLVIAKPPGPTSHDVVALVRRLSGTRRVGHGGTLDPFASGVLPVFLGRATRLVEYHQADRKSYRATICFGARSTTDDLEGELTPVEAHGLTAPAVEAALRSMEGAVSQMPPAFSAIKVAGRRAYALARAGEAPVLSPRIVTLARLELISWEDADPARPVAVVEIDCSPGTYVRAIARDLGNALGSGAYLGALVRTASGPFRFEEAVELDVLRAAAASGAESLRPLLRPIDDGLDALPRVALSEAEVRDVLEGRFVRLAGSVPAGAEALRLVDQGGRLVAIGVPRGTRIVPTKVLASASELAMPGGSAG
jgi:tRNA pseudouridine55 synthase